MKKRIITTSVILLAGMHPLLAQPSLPSDPSQAPIDGGLIWLLLGGGAYAIKKIYNRNNMDEDSRDSRGQ